MPETVEYAMTGTIVSPWPPRTKLVTSLTGQYGVDNLYVGVPVVIGAGGVEKIVEIALEEEAKGNLAVSVDAVKELLVACKGIELSLV